MSAVCNSAAAHRISESITFYFMLGNGFVKIIFKLIKVDK